MGTLLSEAALLAGIPQSRGQVAKLSGLGKLEDSHNEVQKFVQ